MLKEIILAGLMAISPADKTTLKNLETRLKKDRHNISEYIQDPRFEIYKFKKGKSINYFDTINFWYLRRDSIEKCADFVMDNYYWLNKTHEEHGPTLTELASLLQLESRCGKYTGDYIMINSLVSMYVNRPDRRDEYYIYIKDFLKLFADTTDNIILPKKMFYIKGSWAGAYALPQGMPYVIRIFGPKADGDGKVNLMTAPDAIKFTGLLLDKGFGYKKNPYLAIQKYNWYDKNYRRVIIAHAKILEEIVEKRMRILPERVNFIWDMPRLYNHSANVNCLRNMNPAMIPQLSKKQPFIRRRERK